MPPELNGMNIDGIRSIGYYYGTNTSGLPNYDGEIELKHVDSTISDLIFKTILKKEKEALSMGFYNNYIPVQFRPKRIIYNNPATIVFWEDGTKTVVKNAAGNKFNKYNAFTAALAKKIYGNNSRVNKYVNSGIDQTEKKSKKEQKNEQSV